MAVTRRGRVRPRPTEGSSDLPVGGAAPAPRRGGDRRPRDGREPVRGVGGGDPPGGASRRSAPCSASGAGPRVARSDPPAAGQVTAGQGSGDPRQVARGSSSCLFHG